MMKRVIILILFVFFIVSGCSTVDKGSYSDIISHGDVPDGIIDHGAPSGDYTWPSFPTTGSSNFEATARANLETWRSNASSMDDEIVAAREGEADLVTAMGQKLENLSEDTSPELGGYLNLGAFTLTGMTASRVLQTDASGSMEASDITVTELALLDGKTSVMQDLSDDTSPILGGDVFTNTFNIEIDPTPNSDDTASGIIVTKTIDSGQTVSPGVCLCMDIDGELILTDADAEATAICQYMALGSSTGSQEVLKWGYMRNDGWNWTTIGGVVYVSPTAGELTQTPVSSSGQFSVVVGIAESADIINFDPDSTRVEVQ